MTGLTIAQTYKQLVETTDYFSEDSRPTEKWEILKKTFGGDCCSNLLDCLEISPDILRNAHHRWWLELECAVMADDCTGNVLEQVARELQDYERIATEDELSVTGYYMSSDLMFFGLPFADTILIATLLNIDCLVEGEYLRVEGKHLRKTGLKWFAITKEFHRTLGYRYLRELSIRYTEERHRRMIREAIPALFGENYRMNAEERDLTMIREAIPSLFFVENHRMKPEEIDAFIAEQEKILEESGEEYIREHFLLQPETTRDAEPHDSGSSSE